ncbi:unnamed protein product [Choristocarpus tenellus]
MADEGGSTWNQCNKSSIVVVENATSLDETKNSMVVVVGKEPGLEDLLTGRSNQEPFDLASFTNFAKANLFEETVDFLRAVQALKTIDKILFASQLEEIVKRYIVSNANSQVNLSSRERWKAEQEANLAIRAMEEDPHADPNRTVLGTAYTSVLSLVSRDGYARYVNHILVQKHLLLSKNEAMWWTKCSFVPTRK